MRATLRQGPDGRWTAETQGLPSARATASSRDRCVAALIRVIARERAGSADVPVTLVVEELPNLAGVAEAAEIMGWDKRRVITYLDRGAFPDPFQTLASGRVWIADDLKVFAREWRARQARRGSRVRRGRR